MRVEKIEYSKDFIEQYKKLPEITQRKAIKSEKLFRENPFHPSLRLHRLKGRLIGLWSISFSRQYRIIFLQEDDGSILFISIGTHDLYGAL